MCDAWFYGGVVAGGICALLGIAAGFCIADRSD